MPLTRPTTPEEAEERLRNAFVLDDFGDVGGEVEDFPIPDKKSFLKTSATSAWAQGVIGSPVSPYQVGWQGQKDGIVRSYFNEKDASGVSDDDLFSKIAEDYKAKDALAEAARNAAARGESWLGKFREVEQTMPTVAGGRQSSYLGLAREVHDKFREKILPYQGIIRSVAEKARSIETSPEGMDWSGMAQELIQVPKESRPFVLEAISRQATANIDANAASRLGKEFARGFERFLDTAMSGSYNVLAAAGQYSEIPLAPETPQEIEARKARESQDADLMDLRDDIRDISTGKLAKLEDVRLLGMNISGAARNVPMTIGAFVPYIGPAALVGSFQRETANELRRANPTMSRETIEGIATISAPFQALTEVVSDRLLFGKLPNLKRLFTTPAFSAGGIAAQLAGRVALGTATEYAEEFTQGAVPKIVQSLSSDVPDVDWDGYFQDFKDQSPELLATIIPLALFGAGVGQATDYRASVQMLYSADEMMAAKIPEAEARKISELATTGKRPEAESLFRQEFRKAATKGEAPAEMRAAAQRVIAANQAQRQVEEINSTEAENLGVRVFRDSQGWKVETAGGNVINADSAEASRRIRDDIRTASTEYEAETMTALVDDIVALQPQMRVELRPEVATATSEGIEFTDPVTGKTTKISDAKSFQNLRDQAEAIGGNQAESVRLILGDNYFEFGEGIARVFRRARGTEAVPQAITAAHEVIENSFRRGLLAGQWTESDARNAIGSLLPALESGITRLGAKATAEERLWLDNAKRAVAEGDSNLVREVISEMGVRTWIGRDRDGNKTGLRPGTILRALDAAILQEKSPENVTTYQRLRAWFKAVGAYLKGVVATAKIIRDAERNGAIDDFTGFLDKVLGIETATREENEVKDGVIDMAFSLAPELKDGSTFSLAPTEQDRGGLSDNEFNQLSEKEQDSILRFADVGKARAILLKGLDFPQNDQYTRLTFEDEPSKSSKSDSLYYFVRAWLTDAETDRLFKKDADGFLEYDYQLEEAGYQIDDDGVYKGLEIRISDHPATASARTDADIELIVDDGRASRPSWYQKHPDAYRSFAAAASDIPRKAVEKLGVKNVTFSLSPQSGIDIVSDTLESWQDVFDKAAKRNPTRAMAIRDLAQQRINRLGEMWAADRWTAKGDKIRAVVEKRTKGSLDDEQAMREALALDQILEAEGMNSAAAMRSKDSKDYEAWQRFQESKALILSKGEFTEEEAEKLAGASSSAWRKAFVSSIREAVKKAKAESAAWRQEADDMQADDWSPRESLVRDMRVLNVALSAFPPEVRAKVTGGSMVKLAGLATERARYKAIQKALEKAIVETEVFMRKEYTEQVDNALDSYRSQKDSSGRISGKLPSQYTELVDYAYRIREASIEDQATESGGLEKALEESESDQQTQSVLTKMGILRLFEAWEMKDSTAMAAANEWLSETIENGKLGRKLLDEDRKAMLDDFRATAKKDAVPEGKISKVDVDNETNNVRFKVFRRAWQGLNGMLDSAVHVFGERLSLVFGDDSKITDHFSMAMIQAANASNDIKREVNRKYHDMLSVVFNSRSRLAHARGIGQMQKVKASGIMITEGRVVEETKLDIETLTKLADGTMTAEAAGLRQDQVDAALEEWAASERKRTVTVETVKNAGEQKERQMTELQGLQWWLWSRQDASRKQMERDGWTEESFAQLDAFLSPEAKALGEWIAKGYDDAARLIDPVYRRLFRAPLPRVKNYAPIYRNRSGDASVMDLDASDISSGLSAGFTKSRVNTVSPLAEMDAVTVMLTHWENVAHWVTHAEAVRDAKAVLLDRDVMTAIKQSSGNVSANSIKQRIAAIESQGTNAARELVDLSRMWRWIMQYRAFKGLAFRISPVIKQTPALLNPLLADVPAHAYTTGLARAFYDPAAFGRDVAEMFKSDTIMRRVEGGFSAEARIAMQGEGAAGSVALAWMQRGMMPMAWTDAGWTALGAAVSFDYYRRGYISEGMNDAMANAAATKRLEKMIAVSAQPSDVVNRSLIEASSNPFMRSLWMFASDQRKALGIEVTALKKLLSGKSKNKAMDVQRIIVAHVAQAAMSQLMAAWMASLIGDDDDKEREWSREQWTLSLSLGPINGLFVFGRLVDMAGRRILGLRVFPGGNLIEKAADDLVRGGKSMDELFNPEDPEDFINALDALSVGASGVMSMGIGPQAGVVDVTANLVREGNKVIKAMSDEK